jgi:hypothetical protein
MPARTARQSKIRLFLTWLEREKRLNRRRKREKTTKTKPKAKGSGDAERSSFGKGLSLFTEDCSDDIILRLEGVQFYARGNSESKKEHLLQSYNRIYSR